ncbi:hypothetical protein AN931_23725 [Mycobacterium intracellulare subsp. chimaera]|nr:hypothetical protein AN932_23090 [Mycobacterium intracellulare subsp. chimaera]KPN48255.1 hypothetical protein AN931_23725 [Mycobacterium intracellulare subsp. chimaera]KPN58936.1 hypothetical protein AN933_03120 [Mycobacterium intracellulare subsp. chimaera]
MLRPPLETTRGHGVSFQTTPTPGQHAFAARCASHWNSSLGSRPGDAPSPPWTKQTSTTGWPTAPGDTERSGPSCTGQLSVASPTAPPRRPTDPARPRCSSTKPRTSSNSADASTTTPLTSMCAPVVRSSCCTESPPCEYSGYDRTRYTPRTATPTSPCATTKWCCLLSSPNCSHNCRVQPGARPCPNPQHRTGSCFPDEHQTAQSTRACSASDSNIAA